MDASPPPPPPPTFLALFFHHRSVEIKLQHRFHRFLNEARAKIVVDRILLSRVAKIGKKSKVEEAGGVEWKANRRNFTNKYSRTRKTKNRVNRNGVETGEKLIEGLPVSVSLRPARLFPTLFFFVCHSTSFFACEDRGWTERRERRNKKKGKEKKSEREEREKRRGKSREDRLYSLPARPVFQLYYSRLWAGN